MARKRSRAARLRVDQVDQVDHVEQEVANYPSVDQIAARAHELFISGGRRIARIPEYWRAAEAELLERAARKVIVAARRR
jgi:hypothetical protein